MIDLSVIIPAYQAEKTLKRCVASILTNQIDLEVLIVDDGSRDGTAQLCSRLCLDHPQVRFWTKDNGGPGAARAFALEHAQGRFVTFVDADDYLTPKVYESLLPYLNDRIDILEYGYDMVDQAGAVLSHHPMQPTDCHGDQCGLYFARHWNTTNYMCNKLFRRALFQHVTLPGLSAGEDYAALAQLFVFAKGYRAVEQGFYQYVMTPDSLCRKPFSRQRLDNIAAGRFVVDFYRREVPQLCPYALQKLCSSAVNLYCQCVQSPTPDRADICQELKQVFSRTSRELGMVEMLRMGSHSRRMLLLLFSVSPKLCAYLYRKRASE